MIVINRLSVKTTGRKTIDSVSLQLQDGEIVALVGKSGAGKSMLLKTLFSKGAGYEGSILIDGVDASSLGKRDRSVLLAGSFGEIPDNSDETVQGFVSIAGLLFARQERGEGESAAFINQFELSEHRSEPLGTLPEAQLRKTILAHTFARGAKHLLLDNPDAFLDIRSLVALQKAMLTYTINGTGSILFATGNLNFAFQTADRVVALDEGRYAGELNQDNASAELVKKLFGTEVVLSRNIYSGKIEIHPFCS